MNIIQSRTNLPLDVKIRMSETRIRQWYYHFGGNVYVSFSGGKDSTVLLHLVRNLFPGVPAVFCDTGLEFPEIREFVKTIDNVYIIKPKISFKNVLSKYGYPVVSKEQAKYIREVQRGTTEYTENKRRGLIPGCNGKPVGSVSKKWHYLMDQKDIMISERCCDVMKKRPIHKYEKSCDRKSYVGVMADNSKLRMQSAIRFGCNAFDIKYPQSRPLMYWSENNVWEYLNSNNIPYSTIYDMGYDRTGCIFCMFGVHLEKPPNRFQRLYKTHHKLWNYCMDELGIGRVLELINVDPCPDVNLFNYSEIQGLKG